MRITNYYPESDFTKDKHQSPARACMEDCAVLRADDGFRAVASRGATLPVGETLTGKGLLTAGELRFFTDSSGPENRFLLAGAKAPVILYADWLSATGLVLAVFPKMPLAEAVAAIGMLRRYDIAVSPTAKSARSKPNAEAWECMEEILFYLDRMTDANRAFSPLTRCRTAAVFAGCNLQIPLPGFPEAHALSSYAQNRLTAFLFCSFLYLRAKTEGRGEVTEEQGREYRITVTRELEPPAGKRKESLPEPPSFLDLPAFADCGAEVCGGKMTFHIAVPVGEESAGIIRARSGGVPLCIVTLKCA